MKYSNEQLLRIEETAKKNRSKLTRVTDKSKLSTEDKVKLGLCKHFVQFIVAKKMKVKTVAEMIGIPMPRLSEIINYKINKFSIDFLIQHLSGLAKYDAPIKEYLNLFGQTAELPTLSVAKTRQLMKDLKEAAIQV